MSKKKPKAHSSISLQFRSFSVSQKLQYLHTYCANTLGRLPRSKSSKHTIIDEFERYWGQVVINLTVAMKNGELSETDAKSLTELKKLYSYKNNLLKKIKVIISFIELNKRLPSTNDSITLMNFLREIKESDTEKMSSEELIWLKKFNDLIIPYTTVSISQRLQTVLAYTKETGRTPRQHAHDPLEKKYGIFISSITERRKRKPLGDSDELVYHEIISYRSK